MNITRISRRTALAASTFALAAVGVFSALPAQAAPVTTNASASSHSAASASWRHQTPSQVLASTPWKTTGALDQDGNRVALDNPAVSNYVGWAYFKSNGTFTMYNLDDTPKMHGDWTVTPDGSERWINSKDADGKVLFERTVPIVQLTKNVFTYRVFPDAANTSVYYDIVHTKTRHAEPGTSGDGAWGKGHGHHDNGHGHHKGQHKPGHGNGHGNGHGYGHGHHKHANGR